LNKKGILETPDRKLEKRGKFERPNGKNLKKRGNLKDLTGKHEENGPLETPRCR
jgi:hypothetical protein